MKFNINNWQDRTIKRWSKMQCFKKQYALDAYKEGARSKALDRARKELRKAGYNRAEADMMVCGTRAILRLVQSGKIK